MTQRDYNVNPIISYDPITKSEGISIPSPVYHTMMRLTATPRATKFDGLTFFFYYTGRTFKYCSKHVNRHWYVLAISIQITSTSLQWLYDDGIIIKGWRALAQIKQEQSPVRRRAPKNTVNAREYTNDEIWTTTASYPCRMKRATGSPTAAPV